MTEPIELFARQIFEAQPFTCLLGANLEKARQEEVVISLPLRRDLFQQHGFAHGGVISYLADNSITFAGGIALGGDALTAEFKINYIRPAKGEKLVARAKLIHAGRRQAVCQCEIFVRNGADERLCAHASGSVVANVRNMG